MVLTVVLAEFAADILCDDFVDELFLAESSAVKLQHALAVAAVPKTVVALGAVGSLVVDIQHILLLADNLGVKL